MLLMSLYTPWKYQKTFADIFRGYKKRSVARNELKFLNLRKFTLWRPMFPSYRNQPVDLLCKSTDWCLCDGTLVVKGLKIKFLLVFSSLHFLNNLFVCFLYFNFSWKLYSEHQNINKKMNSKYSYYWFVIIKK